MKNKRMWQTFRYATLLTSTKRAEYARKHHIFQHVGEHVRLPIMLIPLHSNLISFHNNVEVASGVRFVTHDAIHGVLNKKFGGYKENFDCIEIMDNVFIGSGSIILPNVRIGPDAVIAAGSVVNKDVPPDSVYAGVPAKRIGSFSDLAKRRQKGSSNTLANTETLPLRMIEQTWEDFFSYRNKKLE